MGDGAGNVGIVAVIDEAQHEPKHESGENIHYLWIKMKKSES